ncbi:MAG: hypothetical protein JNL34_04355 [Anaerolineae bacterium]|nr:hypothetical protein [Anaerolineae bacterium]
MARAGAPQQDIPDSYALAAENETFALYVDDTTLAFKLLDKRSGYLWHSGIDEAADDDRLNRSWQAFARSGISIDVFDNRAVKNRYSITNSETTLAVTPVENGISAVVTFTAQGITVGVVLQLEAEGVRVEMPFGAIREDNPDFRLGQLYLYPFLGATRGSSIPGYMLLPDGTGSLVRFADTTRAKNMFYGRYYGADLGMIGSIPWDPLVNLPSSIAVPVFGMVHGEGENAFLSVVERGAAYGELQAHPSGVITNFNFLYHTFIYNQSYFQATNRSGAGVSTVQRQMNRFDAVVHYRFLTGDAAGYVGLARDYQRYLLDRGQLRHNEFPGADIGIRLEFLGGDKEPALLSSRFVPMTTFAQMGEMLNELQLPNPEVILYGWQPYGASAQPPTTLALDGALGSLSEAQSLADQLAADGGNLSLYLNPQAAIEGEGGYSARNDLAMAITDVSVWDYNRAPMYLLSAGVLRERFASLAADLAAQSQIGLALDGIGRLVYGDFRAGQQVNREAAIAAYQELLAAVPLRLGFYRPNDYVFFVMQAAYDMPLGDNGYIFTTEAVPFLPIVLAGYTPSFGPALNFSSGRQADLLRQVEYGIYPSYFLTWSPTADMLNTTSTWIYSSSYAQWSEPIRAAYDWMNALLGPVRGQPITGHQQLAAGVFATTYASGRQIVVNYTASPFDLNGVTVPAQDGALIEASS